MPVEIRELVIRATVEGQQQAGPSPGGGKPDEKQKQQLVAEVVDQVMEILRHERER